MWILFLILGTIILLGGIISAFSIEDCDYDNETILILFAVFGIVGGVVLTICSIVGLCGGFEDKKETPKTEIVMTDSTQVQVTPDSIYAIQYTITWKDDDGVEVGNNIKLFGKTEKNVGDTITIQLK